MEIGAGFLYSLGKDLVKLISPLNKGKFHTNNFKALKRETDYVIYADGTLILHIVYTIKMVKDGDFVIDKYYECVNPDTELTINKIYKNFYETSKKKNLNRFKKQVLVVELGTPPPRPQSIFTSEVKNSFRNQKTNKYRMEYQIKYTNLRKNDKFKFCISLTVPKEFVINNNKLTVEKDCIHINEYYKEYIFRTKIDKQHNLAENFSPECYLERKKQEPKSCNNIYYKCFEWKFKYPPQGEIIIKFN